MTCSVQGSDPLLDIQPGLSRGYVGAVGRDRGRLRAPQSLRVLGSPVKASY
jgi:hypothetical protein